MLRLLPPVCRDCGKSAEVVSLVPYLDFKLCPACALERDRAVLAGARRKPRDLQAKPKKRASGTKKTKPAPAKTKKPKAPKAAGKKASKPSSKKPPEEKAQGPTRRSKARKR